MKILHTQHLYDPHVGGSEEVIKQLSERLARRGHDVTVATSSDPNRKFTKHNGVTVESFDLSGTVATRIRGSVREQQRYQDFLLENKADLILNSCAQNWSTDLTYPLLSDLKPVKILLPSGYSGLHSRLFKRYFQHLPEYLRQYDHLIYFSPNYQDKLFGDEHGITNYSIIPNAAAEEEFTRPTKNFKKEYGITTPYMLVSVGNHYKEKGHHTVIEAFNKMNRDDVTLVIIGRPVKSLLGSCYRSCKRASQNPKIKVLELERSMTVSALQEADLFVFGSRVEASPLVIVEAMAAKTPFISTNCGCVTDYSDYGRIISDSSSMAEKANQLLDDQQERERLAAAGYQQWLKHQTWEKVVDQYEALYNKLVKDA